MFLTDLKSVYVDMRLNVSKSNKIVFKRWKKCLIFFWYILMLIVIGVLTEFDIFLISWVHFC